MYHVCAFLRGKGKGRGGGGARETIQGLWSFWKRCRMNGIESRSRSKRIPPAPAFWPICFFLFLFYFIFFAFGAFSFAFVQFIIIYAVDCNLLPTASLPLPFSPNEKRANGNIGVVGLKREGGRGCAVTPLAGPLIKSRSRHLDFLPSYPLTLSPSLPN